MPGILKDCSIYIFLVLESREDPLPEFPVHVKQEQQNNPIRGGLESGEASSAPITLVLGYGQKHRKTWSGETRIRHVDYGGWMERGGLLHDVIKLEQLSKVIVHAAYICVLQIPLRL